MLLQRVLAGGLLFAGASAKGLATNTLLQRDNGLERAFRRDADIPAILTRRQNANDTGTAPQAPIPASGDVTQADLAQWEETTKAVCGTALSKLNGQASNPSGIAVCYNLPFLDNRTGVFQAELRMYNLSVPVDPWLGIVAADMSLTLSYLGATVQKMDGTFSKRDIGYPPIKGRSSGIVRVRRQNNGPTELTVLMYVGRINSNLMGAAMTKATLLPLLIPNIEITARSPNGGDVMATLSSQEASFLNGVFAMEGGMATATDAQAAASASAAVQSAAPFVIPGTSLAFFPIGLVIAGIWTALFVGAVGLGTVGRIQFRDQYRRRLKHEQAKGVRTI